jgi:hypothetical protein
LRIVGIGSPAKWSKSLHFRTTQNVSFSKTLNITVHWLGEKPRRDFLTSGSQSAGSIPM